MIKNKKIIFTSGGTGGHIFPAIGIMNYLAAKGYTVVLVTDPRGNQYIRKNMKFKLTSWNVNGIRASIKKGFIDFLKIHDPDIICLQETKAMPEQVELELPKYPHKFWNSAEKKGYSGTAIFSKIEPQSISYGLDIGIHDKEGRIITLEFNDYFLVNVYTPNAQRGLTRLDYRTKEWDVDFLNYLKICHSLNIFY